MNRMLRAVLLLISFCALCALGQLPPVKQGKTASSFVIDIVGTWSSGGQNVMTGLDFYNPFELQFKVPKTSGISYSFYKDGKGGQFFESSQFSYQTDCASFYC